MKDYTINALPLNRRGRYADLEETNDEDAIAADADLTDEDEAAFLVGEDLYPGLPTLQAVAEELNMSMDSLYQRLHRAGILYRRDYDVSDADGREDFVYFVYADFARKDLFKIDTHIYAGTYGDGSTASHMKVTAVGRKTIKAIIRQPTAIEICRRYSRKRK